MPIVPFDTSKSPWLEPSEIVRVKDVTDPNFGREGEIVTRTIYGGTVHFEDCTVKYRNDQLERLGQRQAVVWRLLQNGKHNGSFVPYRMLHNEIVIAESISYPLAHAAIDWLIRDGDTYEESHPDHPLYRSTYAMWCESREKTRRFDAGELWTTT